MFSADKETYEALNALSRARRGERPLVVWIGAGASLWAGYPSWQDVAEQMHSTFSRQESGYDKQTASELLNGGRYPDAFEKMRCANEQLYLRSLSAEFGPKPITAVYERLLDDLRQISPLHILTTNVDEMLERHLPPARLVQQSDIELLPQLVQARTDFICKLHGTASSAASMVFAQSDYTRLLEQPSYKESLSFILGNTTVFFLGYGLRDDYVLDGLRESMIDHPVFGSGPHFLVTGSDSRVLPSIVRRIRYKAKESDHRSALLALETICGESTIAPSNHGSQLQSKSQPSETLYFIADLVPPVKWRTSQTIPLTDRDGSAQGQMIIGEGYVQGEVLSEDCTSLHDIVVGLICFDLVCISVDQLTIAHELLGSEAFWLLVNAEVIRVVIPPPEAAVLFATASDLVGDLGQFAHGSFKTTSDTFIEMPVPERIRKMLKPASGKEQEAERLFTSLESYVIDAREKGADVLADRTRGALVHPSIRSLLGVSEGTPLASIPRWVAYPVLRLGGVIRKGVICERIRASATRMILGSEKLAGAAFCASAGIEWADGAASYALSGRFDSDLGKVIKREPSLLPKILAFRESSSGVSFRKEIRDHLATNDGAQIATAINGGLRQALPLSVLQQARDQLSGLFIPKEQSTSLVRAVLGDLRNADARISRWRQRSLSMLQETTKKLGLGPYSPCPCGSGEKLKFCCYAALQ